MSLKFLLYGSYGDTGSLIARLASERGLRPILAGGDRDKLAARAATLGWKYRAFSLEDAAAADAPLSDIAVVLNCPGPFSRPLAPMVAACLRRQTHDLDITGEIAAYQAAADRDADAKAEGIMLLPGAGFDIVPSDCLAAHLKARLPEAARRALGFQALSRISRGTATTTVEGQKSSGLARRGGILTPVPN